MADATPALARGVRWLVRTRVTLAFCLLLCSVYAVELYLWTTGQFDAFDTLFVARQRPSVGWLLAPLAHSPVQHTHLLGNLAQLLVFGAIAERRLRDEAYLGLIAASGVASIGAQVTTYVVAGDPPGVGTLGASGIAFALTALVVVDSLRYQEITDRWHGETTWFFTLFGGLLSGQALLEVVFGVPGVGVVGHFVGVVVGASFALVRSRTEVLRSGGVTGSRGPQRPDRRRRS